MAWRGIMFWLVLHGCLVFPSTRASLNAYMYNLNLQSNHTEAKILSTRIFGGKSGVEKISTNIFYSGNSGRNNQKVIQVRAGRNLSLKLVNTCEKTSQLSWKSRVIHSIMLCVCLQGHIQEGGRSSLFFAYLCTYLTKKINRRWILQLCSSQDYISKTRQMTFGGDFCWLEESADSWKREHG